MGLQHANSTSFKPGINPLTGEPAMTLEQRKDRQKVYYQRHKHKTIQANWVRQIGALGCTLEMYQAFLKIQDHVCAICKKPDPNGKRLAVDHDHQTQQVRGLLCSWCNRGLGMFRDDVAAVKRAAIYLER
jgi:hypothetical protein